MKLLSIFVVMFVVYGYIYAGDSPLHIAARAGKDQKVQKLLLKGADPYVKNEKELVPVQIAANNNIRAILVAAMNEYSFKVKQK